MMTLTNWTAKRAGGRITVTGVDGEGQPKKITGIDQIEAGKEGAPPIATDKDGTKYYLG